MLTTKAAGTKIAHIVPGATRATGMRGYGEGSSHGCQRCLTEARADRRRKPPGRANLVHRNRHSSCGQAPQSLAPSGKVSRPRLSQKIAAVSPHIGRLVGWRRPRRPQPSEEPPSGGAVGVVHSARVGSAAVATLVQITFQSRHRLDVFCSLPRALTAGGPPHAVLAVDEGVVGDAQRSTGIAMSLTPVGTFSGRRMCLARHGRSARPLVARHRAGQHHRHHCPPTASASPTAHTPRA